jgi:hypothetical protein
MKVISSGRGDLDSFKNVGPGRLKKRIAKIGRRVARGKVQAGHRPCILETLAT